MPSYPGDVLTRNRKGEVEVRRLISRGSFVKYDYILESSGKVSESGKFSIILKSDDGSEEHYFMIPIKGRWMAIPEKSTKGRKLWDDKAKKAVEI